MNKDSFIMNINQAPIQKDELHDSWVELHYNSNGQNSPKKELDASGLYTALNVEKLLKDAQRESGSNSRDTSARGSPKALHSPTGELSSSSIGSGTQDERVDPGTDWIWDWSSGPERNQDLSQKFRHPSKRPRYSVRHTSVMKSKRIFNLENLPTLLFSHACTFVLGAAVMMIYLKKYCHWTSVATSALD